MRKLLIGAAALGLVTLAAPGVAGAGVQFSFGIGLPFPPVVVVPAPYYRPPVYYAGPVYGPPVYYGGYYGPRRYPVVERRWKRRYWRQHRDWDD